MANPQLENGYYRIANEISERLACAQLNGSQHALVHAVLRKTFGFNRKADYISLGQLQAATGLHPATVRSEVTKLKRHRIILELEPATFARPALLGLNKDWEEWRCGFRTTAPIDTEGANRLSPSQDTPSEGANRLGGEGADRLSTKDRIKDTPERQECVSADADDRAENGHPKTAAREIWEHWNGYQELIHHKRLTKAAEKAIHARLREYSPAQLQYAISIFAMIRGQPDTYWSYGWTLEEFMSRKSGKWIAQCLQGDWRRNFAKFEKARDQDTGRAPDWNVGFNRESHQGWGTA